MHCHECGREVPADAAFCPQCGIQLDGDADVDSAVLGGEASPPARRFKSVAARGTDHPPTEKELWTGTYSPQAMAGPALLLAVLTVAGLVVAFVVAGIALLIWLIAAVAGWALLALVLLYRRLTVHYRLTTFRLFHESGLLSRKRDRIEVIDINDVTLRQGFIERMFNVGTIHIQSSDTSDPDLDLPGIDNVREVADLIDDTRRAERQRRGLFMENI